MDRIEIALKIIKKEGIKNYISKLADSDYVTRRVKKGFTIKTELLFISNEFAEQVLTRKFINRELDRAIEKHPRYTAFFNNIRTNMESVYQNKFDTPVFDSLCEQVCRTLTIQNHTTAQNKESLEEDIAKLNDCNKTMLKFLNKNIQDEIQM